MSTPHTQHNDEMNLAWQFLEGTSISVFLTGKAGTGKTTFLRRIRELSPKRMVVVAPTGVAAINAQGVTIHSFFQIAPGVHLPGISTERPQNRFQISKEKKNILRTLDLLVIDEVSMVRADLLDAIDEVLRAHRDRYRPFGGVQLLLIGDLQQLAPVAVDREWELLRQFYDTPYFFSSKALQQTQFVTIELQHIYRQSDSRFIALLSQIRSGHFDASTLAALNERYIPDFRPLDGSDYIRLTTHNAKAQQYNEQQLRMLPTQSHIYEGHVEGDFPESSFPAELQLELKVGAQVMFIKNDPTGAARYYNGKIGHVVMLDDAAATIVCPDRPDPIRVEADEWNNTKIAIDEATKELREDVIGTFRQLPLRLAWAITIHKSQGLTFDHAVLDINASFTHGQVYVALSRCRTLEGIVLSQPVQLRELATDQSVDRFMQQSMAQASSSASQLPQLRFEYFRSLLNELFTFDALQRQTDYVLRIMQEHLSRLHPTFLKRWSTLRAELQQQVMSVATAFQQQYAALLQQNTDWAHDARLQERIAKAGVYFAQALDPLATELRIVSDRLLPDIGNKAVKKQLDNAISTLQLDVRIKQTTLRLTADHGFSVRTYLHDKAQAALHDYADLATTKGKSATKKKAKTPAERKEPTQAVTLRLLREGKSPSEIAKERNLTLRTIYSHLYRFVESGQLQLTDFIPASHIRIVEDVVQRIGLPQPLKQLRQHLPRDVQSEYYTILLAKGLVHN